MTDLSNKTILFYDTSGGYTHVAESVAKDFGNCLYYSYWQTAFPRSRDALPGVGLDGVERVQDFFDALKRADMVCFPDVGNIGLQQKIRDEGIPTWGSGVGARLEQDRWALLTVLKECGLPVPETTPVKGVTALRKVLEQDEHCFVKTSYLRGDVETKEINGWFASQGWLYDIALRLHPFEEEAMFLVQKPIEGHAVEIGIDPYCVDGQLLTPFLFGYEDKDASYLGFTGTPPDRICKVWEKLAPVFHAIQYRAPLSVEMRVTEDEVYVIDVTARYPEPPSAAQCVLIENNAEIMWEGAHGRVVEPVYRAPYVAQLVLRSAWGEEHGLGLEIGRPEAVCIHGHCRFDGKDYAVSPAEIKEFGGAVGIGGSLEEAVLDCFDAAESVKGYEVSYTGSFTAACEAIQEGESLDLPWGRVVGEEKAA